MIQILLFLQQYVNNSVSNKLLKLMIEKGIEIFTSYEILGEYKKVLKRDFHFDENSINERVLELLSYIQVIKPTTIVKVVLKDPDDDIIIECAIDSKSHYIISYNKHLLEIKEYQDIKIMTPEELLMILHK